MFGVIKMQPAITATSLTRAMILNHSSIRSADGHWNLIAMGISAGRWNEAHLHLSPSRMGSTPTFGFVDECPLLHGARSIRPEPNASRLSEELLGTYLVGFSSWLLELHAATLGRSQ